MAKVNSCRGLFLKRPLSECLVDAGFKLGGGKALDAGFSRFPIIQNSVVSQSQRQLPLTLAVAQRHSFMNQDLTSWVSGCVGDHPIFSILDLVAENHLAVSEQALPLLEPLRGLLT